MRILFKGIMLASALINTACLVRGFVIEHTSAIAGNMIAIIVCCITYHIVDEWVR